jgi:hypothetical protein
LRVDSAGACGELLDWCRHGEIRFSVGDALNETARAATVEIHESAGFPRWISADRNMRALRRRSALSPTRAAFACAWKPPGPVPPPPTAAFGYFSALPPPPDPASRPRDHQFRPAQHAPRSLPADPGSTTANTSSHTRNRHRTTNDGLNWPQRPPSGQTLTSHARPPRSRLGLRAQ